MKPDSTNRETLEDALKALGEVALIGWLIFLVVLSLRQPHAPAYTPPHATPAPISAPAPPPAYQPVATPEAPPALPPTPSPDNCLVMPDGLRICDAAASSNLSNQGALQ